MICEKAMLVIGLTGGIGSGKSTVAKLFADHGVPIIDADVITRELTRPDQPAFLDIIDHFDEKILLENGTLDRAMLRKIIFIHPEERRWLEALLHPQVEKIIQQKIQKINAPYCIAVIPLLLEVEPYLFIDRILVVDSPEHMQIERVVSRDDTTKTHVEAIIKTQTIRDERIKKADDIIINDGVLADLIPQVEKLHQLYQSLAKTKR